MMDGWVTIGTELDTKQLEKDIKVAENQLKQFEKEGERLSKQKTKAEIDLQEYEQARESIKQQSDEMLKLAQTTEEVENILSQENGLLSELDTKYSNQIEKVSEINLKIKENQKNQGLLNNKISEMNQKLSTSKGFDSVKNSIDSIGNSMSKTIKKVSRWALAVFGIRGAYMAVRQAMSTISEYDEQLAADVQYMKNALAFALEPVVRAIVNLMKQLMFYVGYIIKAWTGRDIFANANKSLKGANKQAKQLSKTMAGFDEMNILSDTSGGGTGGGTPSFDLTAPEDVPIPGWIKWIADNKDIVISALAGIATGILAIKFGADLLMATGIGLIVTGLILLIQDVIKFISDPSWNNFANILRDLAILLTGVAIAMLAVNAANPVAWIILAVAAIIALVAAIIKYWDQIKEVLGKVGAWIYDHIIKPIGDFFKGLWDGIVNGVTIAIEFIKNVFNNIVSFFSGIVKKILELFKQIGTNVGNVIANSFKAVVNSVLKAIETILNNPIKAINSLIGVINKVPGINLGKLTEFKLPRLAKGGIVNMPGSGVMIGGAIAGERGKEGVIPLTDSQQMALLGEAIGKYITINANITNTMNGRVISRELQRVQNTNDFAFNR